MLFEFGLKSAMLLVFFFHGLVFSVLLLIKGLQNANKTSLWLSLFTFLCSLYICPFLLGYAGWYSQSFYRDILFYIPFQQLLLLPPVLYFYCRALLDKSFVLSGRELIHFLPATLYLIYSVIIFTTDKLILREYYFYRDGKDKDFSTWYQVTGFIALTYYLVQSLKTYRKYKAITFEVVSFAESVMFKWAVRFLAAFLLLLTIRLLFFIVNPEWDQFGKKFWYYICFSLLFYYISISGYVNSLRSFTEFSFSEELTPDTPETDEDNTSPTAVLHEQPDKNEIPDLDFLKKNIERLMEDDKLFENPDLTLSHLCIKLRIHIKKASQVINQGFQMNFNDFVNQYRTRAVIGRIHEGEHHIQTLLSIAFECGFNSKSTFNRAFKRYTSMTPKEYIQNQGPK